ncbi:MAG TPA: hypothetical protein VFL82_17315 [Thermomicrobiales bacterium]|jgi:hypothetical protein|nr:hypothetical protein [Thermomicrobiales bacterium]
MIYELWDIESGNLINAWESEGEALAEVRAFLDAFGPPAVESWTLLRDDDPDQDLVVVAEGAALAARARAAEPATAG